MARLFGFSIDPKEKKSSSIISPVPQNNEDGVDNYISSGFYGSYVDIEGVYRTEFDLIKRYREMALHPECDGAIEDVINDTDFLIRSAFEKWMNVINKMDDGTGIQNPEDYQKDATVHQLDRDGGILRSYKFWDIFPTAVSAIDLNYETTDTLQEFSVEMQIHFWEAFKGTSPAAGGEDIQ